MSDSIDAPIRVVYIEDDDEFGDLTAESIVRESDRIEVETAGTATDGLRRLRDGGIDCVVSDQELPGTSGIEFLETVRAEFADLPFILFTGTGSEAVASRAVSAGVTDYLRKDGGTEQYALLAKRIENAVDRFRSERAATHRKRRLETLVSNLPGIVYRCRNDPGWPMESVDGECAATVGYSCAELESGAVDWGRDVIHDDDREAVWEAVQSAVAAGEPFECTYRVITADGATRWMWERGRVVDGGTGTDESVALEGFITDVTDTKEHQDELRRSRRRFEAVFEDPNLLVGLLDTDGTVRDVNRTALRYIAADRETVIGRQFAETPWWIDEDDIEEWIEAAAAGEYVEYETTHPTSDGGPIAVEGAFRPVTDESGVVTAIIVSARNVTARKERERELRRQHERIDEFAGFVSHDLQSPISAARGRLELAVETGDLAHVEKAREAIERIDDLRTDLVETLRSGEIVTETTDVAVGATLESVWRTIDPSAGASYAVAEPVSVEADRDAFRRLLENLVRNSIEHGGDDVEIRLGGLPEGFYYEDDGDGIDLEIRDRVFQTGFSTKDDAGETGMGMASIRQIVSAHGWDITVADADVLGGARFEIRTDQ